MAARRLRSIISRAQEERASCEASGEDLHWNQLRATMLWSIDAAISVCGASSKPFFSDAECKAFCRLVRLHLLSYQAMAGECLKKRVVLYKLRPKHHYTDHLISQTQGSMLNAMHVSCFLDEDYMGRIKFVVHGCHARTMLTAWARRYLLKRCLLWRRTQGGKR